MVTTVQKPWRGILRAGHALAIGALALTSACHDPRCPALERCDVRHTTCQTRALAQAACLRGRGEKPSLALPVEVISRADYLARTASSEPFASDDVALFRRGLAQFGLYPAMADASDAAAAAPSLVAAYYDSTAGSITIVDDGHAMDDANAMVTLVHEMVHALQDSAGELTINTVPSTFDGRLASRAVSEGEAILLADEAYVSGHFADFGHSHYDSALASYRAQQFWRLRVASYPFDELPMRFPYAEGAAYLWPLRKRAGAAALASAFAVLPVSTRAVLAHDTDAPADFPNDLGERAVPDFAGTRRVGSVHLGGYAYEVVANLYRFDWFAAALPSVHYFLADTLSVFVTDDGNVVSAWRLRFSNDVSADELASYIADAVTMYPADPPISLRVGTDDTDLWLVRAESDEALAALPDSFEWLPADTSDFALGEESGAASGCLAPAH